MCRVSYFNCGDLMFSEHSTVRVIDADISQGPYGFVRRTML